MSLVRANKAPMFKRGQPPPQPVSSAKPKDMVVLTRLEEQHPTDINVPTVAYRFDAVVGAHERTNDECGCFAYGIEGPKFDTHWLGFLSG